jgi:hypothetical protein
MTELSQVVNELYSPRRLKFKRRHIVTRYYNEWAQIDLMQFTNIKKYNKNIGYCALLINCWSRKIYCEPCKTKGVNDCIEAYRKIFNKSDCKFEKIYSDKEKSFQSEKFKTFIKTEQGGECWFTNSDKKASLAENAIRLVKQKLYRLMAQNATYNWLNYLDEAVNETNERIHSGFNKKISSINNKNATEISWFHKNLQKENEKMTETTKYKLNQIVRFCNSDKDIFHKGYLMNYSLRYYKIFAISKKSPNLYILKDYYSGEILPKKFYQEQLIPAKDPSILLISKIHQIDKKRKRAKISWLGYPEFSPEFIPLKNIFKTVSEEKEQKKRKRKK